MLRPPPVTTDFVMAANMGDVEGWIERDSERSWPELTVGAIAASCGNSPNAVSRVRSAAINQI